ncbi:MAG TPA: hypothetical protein DEP53_09810, partial [Bacteroidetes bacterium]|nr:hypothetical protein [Bacteroidota bacterium]
MSTDRDVAWRGNIWAEGSPYRLAAERADSLLGVLIAGLRQMGVDDDCTILVVGDHGQDDGGWHPLQLPDGAITTMTLWGKGIRKGVRIPYAEHIDIVPTLCSVAQVPVPQTTQGQVIAGALESGPGFEVARSRTVKELNEQLGVYNKSIIAVAYAIDRLPETKQG